MQEHKIVGFFLAETGAANSMVPIRCSAEMATGKDELILIDYGSEGRSVPKLSMWLPFLYGIKPYPCAISNDDGVRLACCTHIDSPSQLEEYFRRKTVEMGWV